MTIVIIYVNSFRKGIYSLGKQFTIYRHITPDGKSYIGCTSNTIRERWDMGYQHNHIFSAMCRKYGWYGMQHETLATVSDESEAYKVEQEMITKYQSNNPNFGYNISMGVSLLMQD